MFENAALQSADCIDEPGNLQGSIILLMTFAR
jgi:hypothetical protein